MGFFKKKADPISDRARVLNAQIASLEAQIKDLNARVGQNQGQLRVRSTTLPGGQTVTPAHAGATPPDPIFETVDHPRAQSPLESETTAEHFNDLGVRKYDLLAAWRRLQNHFRAPPAANPKLISYLAAGSIKGLRPLRYEKRVARNRFIALTIFFVLLLWGIIAVVFNHK